MFTGIVEGVGSVRKTQSAKNHRRIWFRPPFSLKGTRLGDSIAIDGCCLTVTQIKGRDFSADISPETLDRTTAGTWQAGTRVNVERPLRVGDRLGGHLVQGHVDGVGKVLANRTVGTGAGQYVRLDIQLPVALTPFVLEKGSLAVDGVSLTVNDLKNGKISLCIIPHTQARTALTAKKAGARVNLEVDMMLKYIEKMLKPEYLRAYSSRVSRSRKK